MGRPITQIIIDDIINFIINRFNEKEVVGKQGKKWEYEEKKTDDVLRNEIPGNDNQSVAIFPADKTGVDFFLKYNAWGWVRISQKPDYVALYVIGPDFSVQYIGEVERITQPLMSLDEAKKHLPNFDENDFYTFEPGKKLMILKSKSIKKLPKPIPWTKTDSIIRSLRYSTIGKLKQAKTTDDL